MTLLEGECIVPCETFVDEKMHFCNPTYVIRVLPEFRKILVSIKEQCPFPWHFFSDEACDV